MYTVVSTIAVRVYILRARESDWRVGYNVKDSIMRDTRRFVGEHVPYHFLSFVCISRFQFSCRTRRQSH